MRITTIILCFFLCLTALVGCRTITFTDYGGLITEDYGTGYTDDWTYIVKGDCLYTNMFDYPEEDYFIIMSLTRKELILSLEEDSSETDYHEARFYFKRAE